MDTVIRLVGFGCFNLALATFMRLKYKEKGWAFWLGIGIGSSSIPWGLYMLLF